MYKTPLSYLDIYMRFSFCFPEVLQTDTGKLISFVLFFDIHYPNHLLLFPCISLLTSIPEHVFLSVLQHCVSHSLRNVVYMFGHSELDYMFSILRLLIYS